MPRTNLSESAQQIALTCFHKGTVLMFAFLEGNPSAKTHARLYFQCVLEWVTPQSWPFLWVETYQAMNYMEAMDNSQEASDD